jgi:hypothetical protein
MKRFISYTISGEWVFDIGLAIIAVLLSDIVTRLIYSLFN